MANTGNIFAGTGENVDRAGLTAWTTPENVVSDNAADATCNATGSDYLVARNFALSAIPDTATINGILVRVEASEHSAGTEPLLAQLQDANAALFGSSKSTSNEGSISGTAKAVYTYGSTSDVWGATLTPAIVKDVDFGVRLWFTTAHDIRVDYVTLAVQYAVAYSMDAATGSFALTGNAATFAKGFSMAAQLGTFALTGNNAALKADRVLMAVLSAFAMTGVSAGLVVGRRISTSAGAFILTGIDAGLEYGGGGGGGNADEWILAGFTGVTNGILNEIGIYH